MIGRKWGRQKPAFVEAGPTLAERVADVWHHRRGPGRWLRLVWYVITAPWFLVSGGIARLFGWREAAADGVRSRRFIHLLQGLPALAAAIGVIAVAGVVAGRESDLRAVYRNEAVGAYQADRPEAAKLFYERLFRLDGGTAETRLFLGFTLEKIGQSDEARHMIKGVADGDAGGDPRANKWVAAKLLGTPETFKDPALLSTAYDHLVKAERGLPSDAEVKLALARYHLALGETGKAIPKMAAAATAMPELNYDLSRVYLTAGRGESARAAMERAESHFRKQVEANPGDESARLHLASCVANLGKFEEAVTVLKEGMIRDPDGPYAKSIARLYLTAYDRLAQQQPVDHQTLIALLRDALRFDPRSVDAAVRLAGFGERARTVGQAIGPPVDAELAKAAQEMLEGLLVAGEHPPAVHMALGLKAWRSDDLETARFHFERAYALDPTLAGVANNLAWVLSHQKQPELDRALEIINSAAEQFPDSSSFLDTRGEIYVKLERWNEALNDFERALPAMRDNARLHGSLATVYENLDKPSIAKRHREEAARLTKDATPDATGDKKGDAPDAAP